MKRRHLIVTLVALAALAAPIAGCGGSSSGATTAQSDGQSQSKPSGGSNEVSVVDLKFTPATLTVPRGARVTVANHGTMAHTATADDGKSFDTGDIDAGSSATVTLSKRGTFKYHCSIHPFMHGTFVVR